MSVLIHDMTAFVLLPWRHASADFVDSWSATVTNRGFVKCARRRAAYVVTSSRMRNPGGFKPPPRVPLREDEKQRAVELLGSMTQRKNITPATRKEVEALVGALPRSREVAQQWKAVLQSRKDARRRHSENPNAFKNRRRILQLISLPRRNEETARCFILLGCLERRYRLSQPPSNHVLRELEAKLGSYPNDLDDTHHYIKTLVYLQKLRHSAELRSPRMPVQSMEELHEASMLLGTFAAKGSVGKQSNRLQYLIGTMPRNKNVATSWKKLLEAAIRKKKRKEMSRIRAAEIETKRTERRHRRQLRDSEESSSAEDSITSSPREERITSVPAASQLELSKLVDNESDSAQKDFISTCQKRLHSFICRILR